MEMEKRMRELEMALAEKQREKEEERLRRQAEKIARMEAELAKMDQAVEENEDYQSAIKTYDYMMMEKKVKELQAELDRVRCPLSLALSFFPPRLSRCPQKRSGGDADLEAKMKALAEKEALLKAMEAKNAQLDQLMSKMNLLEAIFAKLNQLSTGGFVMVCGSLFVSSLSLPSGACFALLSDAGRPLQAQPPAV
jgi:DNA repair exonuclease SbcCD ATPase subunit